MKKRKSGIAFLLALLCCLAVIGCAGAGEEGTEAERFALCLDEMLVEDLESSDLLSLHYGVKEPEKLGIKKMPATLGKLSIEEMERQTEATRRQLERLNTFNPEKLTENQKLDYYALKWYLELQLESGEFDLFYEPNSPTHGVQSQLPLLLVEYSLYSEQDVIDYLALVNDVGNYFDQCIEFQKEKSKAGLFMSAAIAQEVIDGCIQFIEDPENNYMISAFNEKMAEIDWLSAEQKEEYSRQNRTAVLQSVVPAYQRLIKGLGELKGTGVNNGGVCRFPNGKAYYEYLVKDATGSDQSVEEIIQLLEEDMSSMESAATRLFLGDLSLLDRMYQAVPDVTDPNGILEALEKRIQREYPSLGSVKYKVRTIPGSLQESSSPAFYIIPPVDAVEENCIYLNQKYTTDDAMYLFTTLSHEGYPGHLYQTNYYFAGDAHNYRKLIPQFSGYVEGWASYVEYQAYGLSGVEQSIAEILSLDSRLSIALQCRVDIGVNYEGWDAGQVNDYLKQYGIDSGAGQELVDFVAADPANSLSYYIGYLEFQKLREYAEKELGSRFDVVEFHRALLDAGNAPFCVVRQKVEEYVKTAK